MSAYISDGIKNTSARIRRNLKNNFDEILSYISHTKCHAIAGSQRQNPLITFVLFCDGAKLIKGPTKFFLFVYKYYASREPIHHRKVCSYLIKSNDVRRTTISSLQNILVLPKKPCLLLFHQYSASLL